MSTEYCGQSYDAQQLKAHVNALLNSLPEQCQTCPDLQFCIEGVNAFLAYPNRNNRATASAWVEAANRIADHCPGDGPVLSTRRRPPIIGRTIEVVTCASDRNSIR